MRRYMLTFVAAFAAGYAFADVPKASDFKLKLTGVAVADDTVWVLLPAGKLLLVEYSTCHWEALPAVHITVAEVPVGVPLTARSSTS